MCIGCGMITLCQILAKSNNPQLSYRDLKIENLRAVPTVNFMAGGSQSRHYLQGSIAYPHTIFQQNRTTCGRVISGELPTRQCLSEVSGPNYSNLAGTFPHDRLMHGRVIDHSIKFYGQCFSGGRQCWTACCFSALESDLHQIRE